MPKFHAPQFELPGMGEAFNLSGGQVLLAPPKRGPRHSPAELWASLKRARARLADLESLGAEAISRNDSAWALCDHDPARVLAFCTELVKNHIAYDLAQLAEMGEGEAQPNLL